MTGSSVERDGAGAAGEIQREIAGLGEEIPAAILRSPADLMIERLELIRQLGGIESYLARGDVTETDIARLRETLTAATAGAGLTNPEDG